VSNKTPRVAEDEYSAGQKKRIIDAINEHTSRNRQFMSQDFSNSRNYKSFIESETDRNLS